MRTMTRRSIRAAAALAVTAFALLPIPAAAQGVASFTVEVPRKLDPGPGVPPLITPITRVKIVVVLVNDAPVAFNITPPNGDTIRFPSAGTISPGSPPPPTGEFCTAGDCSPLPGTVARDLGWVVPPANLAAGDPGRLRYEIWLDLKSDFDENSLACSNTMQVAMETWTIAIAAGPNVTGACPLSFDAECPGNECQPGCINAPALVPLSVGEGLATVTGQAGSAQVCAEERPALDAILALDKSGSMNGSLAGGATPKIQGLRDAVTEFVDVWEGLRTGEAGGAPAGDQIGLVFFDGDAHWMNAVGVPGWAAIPDGLGSFDARKDDIRNHINSLNAGGSTSIGDGLKEASAKLFDVANAGNGHRKVVLLMSNGMDNTQARVAVNNPPTQVGTYPPGDAANPTPLPNEANLRIYTLTVGPSTAVNADLNEDIATATGGFYINTENDTARMGSFFLELLQNFAKFNTYETVRLVTGQATASAPMTTRFLAGSSLRGLILSVRTDRRQVRLRVTLTPPGGGTPIVQVGGASLVMVPTLPRPTRGGEWLVSVEPLDPIEPTAVATPTPIRLTVLANDAGMRSQLGSVDADYRPGDRIRLRARVERSGRPLLGLGSNAGDQLRVRLVRPGVALGDMLSDSTAPATPTQPGDPATPADAKLANELAKNPNALPRNEEEIVLNDNGNNGDDVAGDGIYSGEFGPQLPGHHDFLFAIESSAPASGPFSRQHLQSVHVRSVPDGDQTQVTTVVQSEPQQVVVTITPRTRFGNRMGPGWGPYFWVVPVGAQNPASVAVRTTDNLNGTYTARVPFTGPTPPDVEVHFVETSNIIDDTVTPDELPVPLGPGTVVQGGAAIASRWSVSLHGGFNSPIGDFGDVCDGGFSFGADLEYRVTPMFAVEAFYGREQFDCGFDDDDVNHFSGNAKAYLLTGFWRPFVGAGIGAYDFSGGSEVGFNIFGGIQANPVPRFGVEGTLRFHFVDEGGVDANFLTAQVGVRIRF